MSVKTRGSGIPLRGAGGGGGSVAVYNTDPIDPDNLVASKASKLVIADGNDFVAYADADEGTIVYLGAPPAYLNEITLSHGHPVNVRVSESDINEGDTYLTGGKENTTLKGSTHNLFFSSTLGRGFGTESTLSVKTYHAGTLVDDVVFTCDNNGAQSQGNVSISISGYTPDGAGDVFQGKFDAITVNGDGLIGSSNSGVCRVEVKFKEQKWEEIKTLSLDIFRDKQPNSPTIDGGSTVRDHDDAAQQIIKYMSGIGYFDLGNPWMLESLNISNLNEDSSHPTSNLSINATDFGISPFTSSPWGADSAEWKNVTNLDTVQGVDYVATRNIDKTSFRHIGVADVNTIVRDSWVDAPSDTSNSLQICVDTVDNPSTNLVEYFDKENMRLSHTDLSSPWNSENYCADGEAIFLGGKMFHGADLPRVLQNVEGALGTAGSLSAYLPDQKVDGTARSQPNYTGHNRPAVCWRKFIATNATTEYAGMNMNILCNQDVSTAMANGDLKVYIWKLGSSDITSVNLNKPSSYSPVAPSDSITNALWAHSSYNFLSFDDGAGGTSAGSGCTSKITGGNLDITFGGFNVLEGILVRFEVDKGVSLGEVSVTFK